MRKLRAVFLTLSLLIGTRFALAQSSTDSALAEKAQALIQTIVKADQFSGTVLVAKNGTPVFRQASLGGGSLLRSMNWIA